ncbi:MAG: alpha/beta fold hydrolase [Dongiaceae bacterium]
MRRHGRAHLLVSDPPRRPSRSRSRSRSRPAARRPAGRRRVICPDLAGRGDSTRLVRPQGYRMAGYLAHLRQLRAALGLGEVALLGVSMGGPLAMALAADPDPAVRELVLVDIGPSVPCPAFELLDLYLAGERSFPGFEPLLAQSHVLPADVAAAMTGRGPRATLATLAGTGHWPALMKPEKPEETALVAEFLAGA